MAVSPRDGHNLESKFVLMNFKMATRASEKDETTTELNKKPIVVALANNRNESGASLDDVSMFELISR